MRCDRERIGRLVDGELPAAERDAVMAHAADCPDCAGTRADLTALRRNLQQAREPAPARLADRLSAALAVAASEDPPSARPDVPWIRRLTQDLAPYLRQAAAVLLACMISIAGTVWWMQRSEGNAALSRDVLAAHVRALIQDRPVQVASLDTHTVKPWFAGRLDYAPVVKDLSAEGFQLVGGRLDFVDGQRVAALVYKRRLHQISVFVWPAGTHPAVPFAGQVEGFNVLGWSAGGMSYWAVSDLNGNELRELKELM